jgi:hypothetical protein
VISFPSAPRVAVGERVRASDLRALADSANARLRSGIGDGVARIGYYYRNAALSLQRPAGLDYYPQADYWYRQQFASSDTAWPGGETGVDSGADTGSILPAYVFGSDEIDLDSEAARLTGPDGMPLTPATLDARGYWDLGKEQRGEWDPETGAIASPSFTAARAYAAIRWRWWSPQGASWGGYHPRPEIGPDCEDPDASDLIGPPTNYLFTLTSLRDGYPDIAFDGSCQDGPDLSVPGMYDTHVAAWGEAPWAYYVLLNDGTLTEYSKAHYVEGPYTEAPYARRQWGQHLERIFSHFASEFRGVTQNEKAIDGKPKSWCAKSFDFRQFLRSQYLLAPARASTMGDWLNPVYPVRNVTVTPSPSLFPDDGCCLAAALVEASHPSRATTVQALDGDGAVIASVGVTPETPAATMRFHPCPAELRFQCTEYVGPISVEVAELMEYWPAPWDWFLVLRISGAINAEV